MMRLTLFALLLVAASAHRVRRDTKTDIKTKMETTFTKLGENFDETCTGMFDENAKCVGYDGMVRDGQTAICEKMKAKMAMIKGKTMTYTVDKLIEEGDIAITFGTMNVKFMRDAEEHVMNMKNFMITKKVDGELKVIVNGVYKTGGEGRNGRGHGGKHRGGGRGAGGGHGAGRGNRARRSVSEKLDALMEKVTAMHAEGKMDEILNLVYADNIVMYTGKGKLIEGRTAVGELYKKKMEKYGEHEMGMTRKHLIEEGDLAIVIGETTIKFQKGGEDKEKKMTSITVFKTDGDSYKAIAKAMFCQKSGNGYERHGPNDESSEEETPSEETTTPDQE